MWRTHLPAKAINDDSGKQACFLRIATESAIDPVFLNPVTDPFPEIDIDDGLVLAGPGLALVHHLATVDAIVE